MPGFNCGFTKNYAIVLFDDSFRCKKWLKTGRKLGRWWCWCWSEGGKWRRRREAIAGLFDNSQTKNHYAIDRGDGLGLGTFLPNNKSQLNLSIIIIRMIIVKTTIIIGIIIMKFLCHSIS